MNALFLSANTYTVYALVLQTTSWELFLDAYLFLFFSLQGIKQEESGSGCSLLYY